MYNSPLVSVGIPNYNYAQYVTLALDSVVGQDYENMEVIIVDDLSTDNSIQVIENWINSYKGTKKITFIKNSVNLGLTKVCNLLLNHSAGKYFQPLDADDILLQGKLTKQVSILEGNKDAAFIYSNAKVINEVGDLDETDYLARINYDCNQMPSGRIKEKLLEFNFVSLPTVLIRTEMVKEVGGFNESLQVQDYYMWLKLSGKYECLYMNDFTAKYRVHSNSMGNSSRSNTRSEDSVLNIKWPYYSSSAAPIQQIIKRNIQNSSVYLYEHNYPTAKKWIKLAFKLKPGPKTFFYFIVSQLGIPFSYIKRLKKKYHNNGIGD